MAAGEKSLQAFLKALNLRWSICLAVGTLGSGGGNKKVKVKDGHSLLGESITEEAPGRFCSDDLLTESSILHS